MRVPQVRRAWVWPVLLVTGAAVVVSAGAVAATETDTVESFWRGLWWSISLVTTVGFLGSPPHSTAGAVVSVVLMLIGFLLLAMVSAALASLFVRQDEQPREDAEREVDRAVLAALADLSGRVAALESRLARGEAVRSDLREELPEDRDTVLESDRGEELPGGPG